MPFAGFLCLIYRLCSNYFAGLGLGFGQVSDRALAPALSLARALEREKRHSRIIELILVRLIEK